MLLPTIVPSKEKTCSALEADSAFEAELAFVTLGWGKYFKKDSEVDQVRQRVAQLAVRSQAYRTTTQSLSIDGCDDAGLEGLLVTRNCIEESGSGFVPRNAVARMFEEKSVPGRSFASYRSSEVVNASDSCISRVMAEAPVEFTCTFVGEVHELADGPQVFIGIADIGWPGPLLEGSFIQLYVTLPTESVAEPEALTEAHNRFEKLCDILFRQ